MRVQALLGYVDADEDLFHDPSLQIRSRTADPATVRVHWNRRRGALLTHGLRDQRGIGLPSTSAIDSTSLTAFRRDTRGHFASRAVRSVRTPSGLLKTSLFQYRTTWNRSAAKSRIALLVDFRIGMLTTVNFDHDPPLEADEIQDVRPE